MEYALIWILLVMAAISVSFVVSIAIAYIITAVSVTLEEY
jgi:hypothetical protein